MTKSYSLLADFTGAEGAILLCTPDAHNRWCVTSQICKSSSPDSEVQETRSSELTSIREAAVRAPKDVVVLTTLSFAPLRGRIDTVHCVSGSLDH